MTEIKDEYKTVCALFGEVPRSNTQLWQHIQSLKLNNLITTKMKNKNQRGRQSFISIPNYSIPKIKKIVEKILKTGDVT